MWGHRSREKNGMKIVLIDPGLGEGGFGCFGKVHALSQINHGLCLISAYAKSKGYKNIRLIDPRRLKGWDQFRGEIVRERPDVAGITMMSCDFNIAKKAIDIIKHVSSQTRVIVGGVHPTVATEEVQISPKIDHIIVGEGEISFVNLLDSIGGKNSRERVVIGVKPNLNDLPFEDRELYDYRVTIGLTNFPGVFKPPMVGMITSRGCPFDCSFCAPHARIMFGKKVRFRSVGHVIEELKILRNKYNFKSIQFFDYSFTLSPEWVYEFCDKYQKEDFKAQIWANSRTDLICRHEDAIKRLREAGLRMLAIGFESGSQRMLDFMNKGTTLEQNIKAIEFCRKCGIVVRGLFILGLPTETREDVMATLRFIKKAKPDIYSFSYFTPMPGSYLYEYCKRNNLSLIKSHDELAIMGPSLPKIKGVDYQYLKSAVEASMGFRFGGRVVGKFIRYLFIMTRKGRLLKLREFLKYCYVKYIIVRQLFFKDRK